jgi:1,4-alpha-glucan branching enzyme
VTPHGSLCLVLHAHLPYVRHPDYESFFEENWFFEALTETYIPLVGVLDRLLADQVPARLTLSLSPTLMTMLGDPFLQERYLVHLDKLRRLAALEVKRTEGDSRFAPLAHHYERLLDNTVAVFEGRWNRDLLAAFAHYRDEGLVELITTAATHGFLPLLKTEPQAVRAQLLAGQQAFQSVFGKPAQGVWLPECGYYRGIETVVAEAGYGYFFVDSHAIENAEPRPMFGVTAPLALPNGTAAFGREPTASRRVWSRDEGYPGDGWYRDFYRDIGFDLDFDYIKPFILDGKTRIHTGFKYHRITDRSDRKEVYEPGRAAARVAAHVEHFCDQCRLTVEGVGYRPGPPPVIVAPYDAELFGHWWFEGPQWLEGVLRTLARKPGTVDTVTAGDYLAAHPTLQCATPSPSSWGDGGYNSFWLNPSNDWIYPRLDAAARRMSELVRDVGTAEADSPVGRALRQAARCLLLAQASDWPFLMKSGTGTEYALRRLNDHLDRFHYLETAIRADAIDERRLTALEFMDNIFPGIDPALFA